MRNDVIEITSMGSNPTFIVEMYGSPVVTFPLRQAFVVELWSDWEWIG